MFGNLVFCITRPETKLNPQIYPAEQVDVDDVASYTYNDLLWLVS